MKMIQIFLFSALQGIGVAHVAKASVENVEQRSSFLSEEAKFSSNASYDEKCGKYCLTKDFECNTDPSDPDVKRTCSSCVTVSLGKELIKDKQGTLHNKFCLQSKIFTSSNEIEEQMGAVSMKMHYVEATNMIRQDTASLTDMFQILASKAETTAERVKGYDKLEKFVGLIASGITSLQTPKLANLKADLVLPPFAETHEEVTSNDDWETAYSKVQVNGIFKTRTFAEQLNGFRETHDIYNKLLDIVLKHQSYLSSFDIYLTLVTALPGSKDIVDKIRLAQTDISNLFGVTTVDAKTTIVEYSGFADMKTEVQDFAENTQYKLRAETIRARAEIMISSCTQLLAKLTPLGSIQPRWEQMPPQQTLRSDIEAQLHLATTMKEKDDKSMADNYDASTAVINAFFGDAKQEGELSKRTDIIVLFYKYDAILANQNFQKTGLYKKFLAFIATSDRGDAAAAMQGFAEVLQQRIDKDKEDLQKCRADLATISGHAAETHRLAKDVKAKEEESHQKAQETSTRCSEILDEVVQALSDTTLTTHLQASHEGLTEQATTMSTSINEQATAVHESQDEVINALSASQSQCMGSLTECEQGLLEENTREHDALDKIVASMQAELTQLESQPKVFAEHKHTRLERISTKDAVVVSKQETLTEAKNTFSTVVTHSFNALEQKIQIFHDSVKSALQSTGELASGSKNILEDVKQAYVTAKGEKDKVIDSLVTEAGHSSTKSNTLQADIAHRALPGEEPQD